MPAAAAAWASASSASCSAASSTASSSRWALRLNISAEYFKLVSAVIVAVAIAAPNMKDYVHLAKIKSNARKLRALSGKGDETDA